MPTIGFQQALKASVADRGSALAQIPEDQWFDRVSARIAPRDVGNHLVGLANAEGGALVIGIHDGVIEGVATRNTQINAWRQAAMDFTEPTVRAKWEVVKCRTTDDQPEELLVFHVEPSDIVHANVKDEVFLRVGDENRKLSFREREELIYDKGQTQYEATPVGDSSVAQLDTDLLASYAEAMKHPEPERLLAARGLLVRGGLTVASVLLFAEQPQARFPEAHVRVLRYRGLQRATGSRQQVLHDVRCEGPIPHLLLKAQAEVRAVEPARRALNQSGKFGEVPLIPADAWLEGIVNAVVHRSYSMAGDHIRVEIFEDRIEIESPGRFPGLVALEDPENSVRFARNPRIARVCADLNFGQELGEGIRRMFDEMRLAGLSDPLYTQTAGSVRLVLSSAPFDRRLEEKLPARSRQLLRVIRDGGRASTGDLVEATQLSRPAVLKRLRALEESGLIRWVGKSPQDPRAYWEIARIMS